MLTQERQDQVLWMADCYSLAKRFHNPHTWMLLLDQGDSEAHQRFHPFHYWLWMEIWKAAQGEEATPPGQA